MDRSNHYEAAFEAYLQWQRLCYVAVDETRRAILGETPVKSLDFIVFGDDGARLLVDVKGRRFPGGRPERPRRVWECWSTRDDIDGLERWAELSGPGYRGLLVFAYHCCRAWSCPTTRTTCGPGAAGATCCGPSPSADYRALHARPQPASWGTVTLPHAVFRSPGPAVAPLHPRPARPPSRNVRCSHEPSEARRSPGIAGPAAAARPVRGGPPRRGRRAGRRGRRPVAEPAVGDRPARVPPPAALPQPGIDRPRLSAAARPRRGGGPAAAHRARPQGDDAQLRPRPARRDRRGRPRAGRGRGAARPAADRVADWRWPLTATASAPSWPWKPAWSRARR